MPYWYLLLPPVHRQNKNRRQNQQLARNRQKLGLQRGGTLRIVMQSDPMNLNAIMTNNMPDLAITNIVFQLREDVKWHDGEPFTAEDVLFTFETVQADNETEFQSKLVVNEVPIEFEAPDDYIIRAILPEPYPAFITQAGIPIVPKHLLQDVSDLSTADFNTNPVGTGAFAFAGWPSGESVTLEANETYWGGKPYLDEIVFKVVPSVDAGVLALQSGELDLYGSLPARFAIDLEDDDSVDLTAGTVDLITYLLINHNNEVLHNKLVRKALAHAINIEPIVETAYYGYVVPADSYYTPLLVAATLGIASAILTESALSFLGLGVQQPDASWGSMLQQAHRGFAGAGGSVSSRAR